MPVTLRDVRDADLPAVLDLNEASVPAVNSVTLDKMQWFRRHAPYFRIAEDEYGLAAFLIGFRPGSDYESRNYRWFCSHFDDFAYVDRIAVAGRARRAGRASQLYADFEVRDGQDAGIMVCEVNIEPPNPDSMRFHQRMGFRQIGELRSDDGSKSVAMMEKRL